MDAAREPLYFMFQLADLLQCFQGILVRLVVLLAPRLLLVLQAGVGICLVGYAGGGSLL